MAKKKPIREYIRVRIGKPAFSMKAGFHFCLLCAGIGCGRFFGVLHLRMTYTWHGVYCHLDVQSAEESSIKL